MHSRIGDVAAAQGRMGYALQNYQAGLAVIEPVAAADPSMALFQHDLFTLHARLGAFLREQGRHAEALDQFYSGLAVAGASPMPMPTICAGTLTFARPATRSAPFSPKAATPPVR